MKLNQVTVSVSDITLAREFYLSLGWILIVSTDHYCRFMIPGNEATYSVELAALVPKSATTVYLECDDLDEKVQYLKSKGVVFDGEVKEQPWLWKEIYLCDPDGNRLCFYYAGENRLNPPWRVK
jgi:catechol 2,3-dioxygenase-like lactoylglutathione lyase family enzyme